MKFCLLFSLYFCLFCMIHAESSFTSQSGNISFDAEANASSELIIKPTGEVLIGGTTGNNTLTVSGNVYATEDITARDLSITGEINFSGIQNVSGNTTLSGNNIILVDTSSDNITITLPSAVSVLGRNYHIKKTSTLNQMWVTSSSNIDKRSGYIEVTTSSGTLSHMSVLSNGSEWFVFDRPSNAQYILALFDSSVLNVTAQDATPQSMLFNNNGTKLYVLGATSDAISQYNLGTAYDVSSGTFSSSALGVSAQEGSPKSMMFNNNGTKLYVLGSASDTIHQYNLSTAYDISSGTYNSAALDISAQETTPKSMLYNNDGTKLYVLGSGDDDINQYNLSTAYDISTASFSSIALSVASEETNPSSMLFNSDGMKLYVLGADGDDINQYNLSTAYDVSTGVFHSVVLDVSSEESSPQSMIFNNNYSKLYILGTTGDIVKQYILAP